MDSRVPAKGDVARRESLSREALALYRELLSTYSRLYALARGQEYEHVNSEVQRTGTLVDRLRCITAEGAAIDLYGAPERTRKLEGLWAETVCALTEIEKMRGLVLQSLDRAVDETRDSLARLARNRAAPGAYRRPRHAPPRLRSCRLRPAPRS